MIALLSENSVGPKSIPIEGDDPASVDNSFDNCPCICSPSSSWGSQLHNSLQPKLRERKISHPTQLPIRVLRRMSHQTHLQLLQNKQQCQNWRVYGPERDSVELTGPAPSKVQPLNRFHLSSLRTLLWAGLVQWVPPPAVSRAPEWVLDPNELRGEQVPGAR